MAVDQAPFPAVEASLDERVDELSRRLFQGRQSAIGRVVSLASDRALLPHVLTVRGPPGIGKTAFLRVCRHRCRALGVARFVLLDVRDLDHSAAALPGLVRRLVPDWPPPPDGRPVVLALDSFEELGPGEPALYGDFLDQTRGPALVILAGCRGQPEAPGQDPAWRDVLEEISLGPLSREDSLGLLQRLGVTDPAVARDIVRFAEGNPLALSTAAGLAASRAVTDFAAIDSSNDVVRALLARLVREAHDPSVRELLEAAAVVHVFDEDLLTSMVRRDDRGALERLCRLSIVRTVPAGLTLRGPVRRLLAGDLRWRRPDRSRELRVRACRHLCRRRAARRGEPSGARVPEPYAFRVPFPVLQAQVKDALRDLYDDRALSGGPLLNLCCLGDTDRPGHLRRLLLDAIEEMARSPDVREGQAGAVLTHYYVRPAGTHERVAERLDLPRTTFYRRLRHGLAVVARRLRAAESLA